MVRKKWVMRPSSMLLFPDTIAPYTGARIETEWCRAPLPWS
ncbi:hypothetical protein BLGI_4751 [Brevibacillus laterosporus GI-9]|nr:hypothetical protein BLGI_4751 [Brevibacillus laterosporus GI-9]